MNGVILVYMMRIYPYIDGDCAWSSGSIVGMGGVVLYDGVGVKGTAIPWE